MRIRQKRIAPVLAAGIFLFVLAGVIRAQDNQEPPAGAPMPPGPDAGAAQNAQVQNVQTPSPTAEELLDDFEASSFSREPKAEGTPAASAASTPVSAAGESKADVQGKISLDLKGIDIVELLKILSMKMGVNIVPTKEVTGRANVYLNNVTYEDALDIILINNGLAAVHGNNNIITVMTTERYTQLYGKKYEEPRQVRTIKLTHAAPKDVLAALTQLKTDIGKVIVDEPSATVIIVDIPEALELMERTTRILDSPKDTEIFSLKYAKAEDIKEQLGNVLTSGSSNVELDARTNKIAISDLPDKMKQIKKLIAEFDDATKQVSIEAQIVQVSLTDETQYGINWDKLFKLGAFGGLSPTFSSFYPTGTLASYNKFSVGTLATNNFDIVIQALNSLTKANILSRPRITVTNNQEASILIGSKEVYFSQTQSQSQVTTTTAESVNYVDVGVKLNVTPTISADGYIVMKIRPEVSTVREYATSPLGSKVPVVETSQAETTVKIKDGSMIMIAGLMKDQANEARKRMPFLGKLPGLRWLFGNFDNTRTKTELAVFLTPHIITGDSTPVDAEKEQVKVKGVVTKKIKGQV